MNSEVTFKPEDQTYFSRFSERFSDFAVASSVAGGDEVGDAAALQERGGRNRTGCAE